MANYLYKVQEQNGATYLGGFHSREEAEKIIPMLKKDKVWEIKSYKAEQFETN